LTAPQQPNAQIAKYLDSEGLPADLGSGLMAGRHKKKCAVMARRPPAYSSNDRRRTVSVPSFTLTEAIKFTGERTC
jgi:hypothetical protein